MQCDSSADFLDFKGRVLRSQREQKGLSFSVFFKCLCVNCVLCHMNQIPFLDRQLSCCSECLLKWKISRYSKKKKKKH